MIVSFFRCLPLSVTSVRTINMLYFLWASLMVTAKTRRKWPKMWNSRSIFSQFDWMAAMLDFDLVNVYYFSRTVHLYVYYVCYMYGIYCVFRVASAWAQINDNGSPSRPYKHTYGHQTHKRAKKRIGLLRASVHRAHWPNKQRTNNAKTWLKSKGAHTDSQ